MADYDVVLLPSFAQVEDWRKAHAAGGGLFSQVVTTFNGWVTDLWELHGDGRQIVDSLQRRVIMQVAFDGQDYGLSITPGVIKLAASCVRAAAGVAEFEAAVRTVEAGGAPQGVSQREAALLAGVAKYYELLEEAGFVELGQAASLLASASTSAFPQVTSVLLAHDAPLDWIPQRFFEACPQLRVARDAQDAIDSESALRANAPVDVRFAFPSGRYAQPALVADLIRQRHVRGQVGCDVSGPLSVVACKDPLAMYKQLEAPLAKQGIHVCVQAKVPFASTDFGRQFMSMWHAASDEVWSKDRLSDAVLPPFSGFGPADALDIDKQLRQDRLADRDDCLARLRMESDTFSHLEELAGDPEADILLGVFEQIAFTAAGRSDAWRAEQLSAAAALRSCTSAARTVGADMRACVNVLEDVSVTASYEGLVDAGVQGGASCCGGAAPEARPAAAAAAAVDAGVQGSGGVAAALRPASAAVDANVQGDIPCCGRVVVTTQPAAALMGPGSCDYALSCDMTSEDYPVADKDDAAATLFGKLGLIAPDSALAQAHRTFAQVIALPTRGLLCVRPMNDWNGQPTYPAAVLQELIDSYRADPASEDDIDDVFGLPDDLRRGLVQRGEELLFANDRAAESAARQLCAFNQAARPIGFVDERDRMRVALARRDENGLALPGFSPSPSQVEAYLDCPYKWFAQSRLKVEELDEGFGALERGSFAHAVLREFYQRYQASGRLKVAPDDLPVAKALIADVADELARAQYELAPGSGRYVPADQMEAREVAACKAQLMSYLDFEAQLLPGFHPLHLEYEIKPENGVRYAGHAFVGTVDRIDVDDAGNAVVIDYKGSVNANKEHQIAGKTKGDPGKVQARMYAQVVRRQLGLNVVGALYVSYGKKHACAGAYDGRVLESAHLPAMRHELSCCAIEEPFPGDDQEFSQHTFSRVLDMTEALVERAIARMEAGQVEPNPVSPSSCAYCVAASCPNRGA